MFECETLLASWVISAVYKQIWGPGFWRLVQDPAVRAMLPQTTLRHVFKSRMAKVETREMVPDDFLAEADVADDLRRRFSRCVPVRWITFNLLYAFYPLSAPLQTLPAMCEGQEHA